MDIKGYWTGVGDTEIEDRMYDLMVIIGQEMTRRGYIFRSGHAPGSDDAFEEGVFRVDPSRSEVWLPWQKFQEDTKREGINYIVPTKGEYDEARQFYIDTGILSWFDNMKQSSRNFHARNYRQGVGNNDVPSKLCIFAAKEDEKRNVTGGTRSAVMILRHFNVPTVNLNDPIMRAKLLKKLDLLDFDFKDQKPTQIYLGNNSSSCEP